MHLTDLGFKTNGIDDVKAFQAGWNLGPALAVDGIVGLKTRSAMHASLNAQNAGWPNASAHFWFTEFACQCHRPTCPGIRVLRPLLIGLEKLRDLAYPRGLRMVSGYRCPEHNRAVGGARYSQHQYGSAVDLYPVARAADVLELGVFSGVGAQTTIDGLVRHVDVRHASGHNTTESTVRKPSRWHY